MHDYDTSRYAMKNNRPKRKPFAEAPSKPSALFAAPDQPPDECDLRRPDGNAVTLKKLIGKVLKNTLRNQLAAKSWTPGSLLVLGFSPWQL